MKINQIGIGLSVLVLVVLSACNRPASTESPVAPSEGSSNSAREAQAGDSATEPADAPDADAQTPSGIFEDGTAVAVSPSQPATSSGNTSEPVLPPEDTDEPVEAERLQVGQQAPEFQLKDQHGQQRSLGDLLKQGNVALVFYRSADW